MPCIILKKRGTFCRPDEGFDKSTFLLAKQAGCRQLNFGLESINERILNFINKGTKIDTIKRIVHDADQIGLPFTLQVMIGVPSETVEEALETITFLAKIPRENLLNVAFNNYYLIKNNYVFANPGKYGVKITDRAKLPFKYFYRFKHLTGEIDFNQYKRIVSIYKFMCKKKSMEYEAR